MKKPYVIAVNSIGGGVKTALTELLHASLSSSELLAFDDFGEDQLLAHLEGRQQDRSV